MLVAYALKQLEVMRNSSEKKDVAFTAPARLRIISRLDDIGYIVFPSACASQCLRMCPKSCYALTLSKPRTSCYGVHTAFSLQACNGPRSHSSPVPCARRFALYVLFKIMRAMFVSKLVPYTFSIIFGIAWVLLSGIAAFKLRLQDDDGKELETPNPMSPSPLLSQGAQLTAAGKEDVDVEQ